jgi:hypothetical protein
MKTIQKLIDSFTNTPFNLNDITKEDLFSIKTKFAHGDNSPIGCTIAKAVDENTEPGAILLWEFNAVNFHEREFNSIEAYIEAAHNLKYFVKLLERLKISTRYDCFDSFGSQNEDPRIAVVENMIFEADEDAVNTAKEIVVRAGLMTETEFNAEYVPDSEEYKAK